MKVKIKNGKSTVTEDFTSYEVDIDYTQMYGCFNNVSKHINSVTSFKLLFWLLSNRTHLDNTVDCSDRTFKEFNIFLEHQKITQKTYYNCLSELVSNGILKKHSRGNYVFNMFVFWKGYTEDRLKRIKANYNTGESIFINPSPNHIEDK